MKTLYLDLGMGVSGDMLAGALLELLPDKEAFVNVFNSVGIPGVYMEAEDAVKCGIKATHVKMVVLGEVEESHDVHAHAHGHEHEHEHAHTHEDGMTHTHSHVHAEGSEEAHKHEHAHGHEHTHEHVHVHMSMDDIEKMVRGFALDYKIKENILAVYREIAKAESEVHGVEISEVHFHEVGMMDAVADISAVCMLMDWIGADEILCSPVNTGSGRVRCAHGVLPVPAPATASLLKGIPSYQGEIEAELATPTGVALIKHFATRFCKMPEITAIAIGYGAGTKDFETANLLRAVAGKSADRKGEVLELACNVDDMTAEELGYAIEKIMEGGALDAWLTPIVMKKSRLASKLEVLCREDQKDEIASLIFRYTTTLGVRMTYMDRYELARTESVVNSSIGKARIKESVGYGVNRNKIEYDDAKELAEKYGITLQEAKDIIYRGRNR